MFEETDGPRVFGVAPGVDFPHSVAQGILRRLGGARPEALARVRIFVNTRRMQRRIKALFSAGAPRLLPRINLVTEIDSLVPETELAPPISPLKRRMELAELVAALIEADPSIAPRAALFDLSDSLAALLDEMQGEGVDPSTVVAIDTGDDSGHWARSQAFLGLVIDYLSQIGNTALDPEARRRAAVAALRAKWKVTPPQDPVIIAGSTGSRGTTAAFMKTVASLPQGALILPGYDMHAPDHVWTDILEGQGHEDHPQYRFATLLQTLGIRNSDVDTWGEVAPSSRRNSLISLSLRPAPVTHQWLEDGPGLGDLRVCTEDISLIEAPNQRKEAAAIAVAMRLAIEGGESVALVTPDRTLGRRVTATLARWDIMPDDSAGRPLAQTPPGRLLRQVARISGAEVLPEELIALLRHPLTHTDGSDRGRHLLMTQELELFLRDQGVLAVSDDDLAAFVKVDARRKDWASWIVGWLGDVLVETPPTVQATMATIVASAEKLARGPSSDGSGELWERAAGRDTRNAIDGLLAESVGGPEVTREEVARLLDRTLQSENTRNSDDSRPDVMIWGTLEARVQGADLVILGGLNEGTWPARPSPDPWLNRRMRRETGLLLPERQVGLSAHDYQQAVAARRVVLSRALRDDDAETVPSRWLNRLTNLVSGLPLQNGVEALKEMRARGRELLEHADDLDRPTQDGSKATRPSPSPPVNLRPKVLSVTEIETLIRDPYAVYARRTLNLRALKPLRHVPDAAMRGTVFHTIMHDLIQEAPFRDEGILSMRLLKLSAEILERDVPWPDVRALWLGHLERIAPRFAELEIERLAAGQPIAQEVWGELEVNEDGLGVHGKADRIDRLSDGRLAVYDYKSGAPPTLPVILQFKRQLPIEAVMAEAGVFKDVDAAEVAFVSHIGLNKETRADHHKMIETADHDLRTVTIKEELVQLLSSFMSPGKGYPSRRAMEKVRWDGDYDHLARFGEWDDTQKVELIDLK